MPETTVRTDPSGALEVIPWNECMELIATVPVGRLAVAEPFAPPDVFPMNFVIDAGSIVLRSDPGTKLDLLARGVASFQVDQIHTAHRTGWSVLVKGHVREIHPPDVAYVQSFVAGAKSHWIRLIPDEVTGRRITLPESFAGESRAYL